MSKNLPTSHTPGPWKFDATSEENPYTVNDSGFTRRILSARTGKYEFSIFSDGLYYPGVSSNVYDWHLIGAATELLEDLKDAAKTFREYEAKHKAKNTWEGDGKALENAVKAARFEATIRKAEGREEKE